MKFQFKELQLEQEGSWLKRFITKPHTKRTLIAIAIGGIAGLLFWFFTEGQHMEAITASHIIKSILLGGFFGFFITNSPCARGRC